MHTLYLLAQRATNDAARAGAIKRRAPTRLKVYGSKCTD